MTAPVRDKDLTRLLRWYPPAWRERYGEEFLAMVQDTLDGQAYGNVLIASALRFVIAIGLCAMAVTTVAKHLDLSPQVRAAETLLAAVILTGVMTMVPVQIIWYAVVRSSTLWLGIGLTLLAGAVFTAPTTLRQARRSARRQRAAAVRQSRPG